MPGNWGFVIKEIKMLHEPANATVTQVTRKDFPGVRTLLMSTGNLQSAWKVLPALRIALWTKQFQRRKPSALVPVLVVGPGVTFAMQLHNVIEPPKCLHMPRVFVVLGC